MSWTWKWFDMAIVIAAVAIGFAVFLIPSIRNSENMKELIAADKERRAIKAAYDARQAEIKQEQEELGLVFLSSPSELPSVKAEEEHKKRELEELNRAEGAVVRESPRSPAVSPKQQ